MPSDPDKPAMRKRVSYLRAQAASFRKMAALTGDVTLTDGFEDLARRCDEIAATIERNLGAGIYDWAERPRRTAPPQQ